MRTVIAVVVALLTLSLDAFAQRVPRTDAGRAVTDLRSWHDYTVQRFNSPYFDSADVLFWETWYEIADARKDVDVASRIERLYIMCTSAHLTDPYARTNTPRGEEVRATCTAHEREAAEYRSRMPEDVAGLLRSVSYDAVADGDLSEFRAALRQRPWIDEDTRRHLEADAAALERKIRRELRRGR